MLPDVKGNKGKEKDVRSESEQVGGNGQGSSSLNDVTRNPEAFTGHKERTTAEITENKEKAIERFKRRSNDAVKALKIYGEHLMAGIEHGIDMKWRRTKDAIGDLVDKSIAKLQAVGIRIGDAWSRFANEVKKIANKMNVIGRLVEMERKLDDLKKQVAETQQFLKETHAHLAALIERENNRSNTVREKKLLYAKQRDEESLRSGDQGVSSSKPIDRPSYWSTFFTRTANMQAWPLTRQAVEKIPSKEGKRALDLGCGTGRDTKFLVDQGFHVTSVDNTPEAITHIETFKKERGLTDTQLTTTQSTFDTFSFEKEKYDIVNASFALPFNPPETFDQTFSRMKDSIQKGGLFTGQLFGKEDEWSTTRKGRMTFHSIEEARALFSNMNLIHFQEVKGYPRSSDGTQKNWHYFHIIAQK